MEHNPNSETKTKPSENYSVAGLQEDKGGVDTNTAGPSESKESLLIELEINQNNEATKPKNNNDRAETLEFGNNYITDIIIQDKESGKNQYICKFCSQVFDKHQALGGHMNGHSKDQRNLEKFGKVATWIHTTYPPPPNTTLASEAELQGIATNGAAYNSSNHLVEVGNVYSQLGGQQTHQQSTQQIQMLRGLQIPQQQLQYYQAQELQRYQYSQGFQANQAPKGLQTNQVQSTQALQSPQNYQVPQRLQNYQTPQGLQNYQTPQGLQNHQVLQGFQSYQTPQQFQNYQTLQEPEYYQALQGSQNYQASQGPQYYQTPQRPQHYLAPQRIQNYQTPQGPQSYQALQGSQSYQAPQGSQIYQASQRSQSYQLPKGPKQLVVDANNQQKINLNSKTSSKPTSLAKIPSSEHKNNLSNPQGTHFQEEAQGPQRYMPNPNNLRNGDRLTTGPFIKEQLNKEYYAKLGSKVLKRSNQMISTSHNYDTTAQYKPTNSPNTSDSFSQSKDE